MFNQRPLIIILISTILNGILPFQTNEHISYNVSSKFLNIVVQNETLLSAKIGNSLPNHLNYEVVLNNEQSTVQIVNFKSQYESIELKVVMKEKEDIKCSEISWKTTSQSFSDFNDCLDITESFWYGGSEMKSQQFWPINDQVC